MATPAYKIEWATTYPNGLALLGSSSSGTIYVAGGYAGTSPSVQLFTTAGTAIGSAWVSFGGTSFGEPDGVAVNQSTGNVYVVDRLNSAVYEFTSSGTTIVSWTSWSGGSITSFSHPEGIAVDPFGNIFVADTGNNTVEEFTTSGSTVNYVNQWNTGTQGFFSPSAVAAVSIAGPTTVLYVADAGNELVQVFDGTTWTSWSTISGADIAGITVDASGNVYTADIYYGLVEEYNPSGVLLTQWNQSGSSVPFVSPDGLLLNGAGDIYVTDFENGSPSSPGTVQEFGP